MESDVNVIDGFWQGYLLSELFFNTFPPRARSIYERALDVDHRNIALWLKYAEMEMKNRQVNHARNIWDRAITILPRVNQFWYLTTLPLLNWAYLVKESLDKKHSQFCRSSVLLLLSPFQVQVQLHGRDAGQHRWLQTGVWALDRVGTRGTSLALLHQLWAALQRGRQGPLHLWEIYPFDGKCLKQWLTTMY